MLVRGCAACSHIEEFKPATQRHHSSGRATTRHDDGGPALGANHSKMTYSLFNAEQKEVTFISLRACIAVTMVSKSKATITVDQRWSPTEDELFEPIA